jgi:hypothetical protein
MREILLRNVATLHTARERNVRFTGASHHEFDNIYCWAPFVDEPEKIFA